MRTPEYLNTPLLAALMTALLVSPALAEPAARPTPPPSPQSPTMDGADVSAVESHFQLHEREIRQAINTRDYGLARERIELARRMVDSAKAASADPLACDDCVRQLESLARFVGSEQRMAGVRRPRVGSAAAAGSSSARPPPPFDGRAEALRETQRARVAEVTGASDRIVAYPDQAAWQAISARDPLPTTSDSEVPQHMRETAPAVRFAEGTQFEEIVAWLRERSGLSFHVNWNTLALAGVDRTTPTSGLVLQNARFETILRLVLDNLSPAGVQLDYDIYDGIVRISTREHLEQRRITRVYDVSDLLVRLPSFRSEDSGFGLGGGFGMGTGMGMGMGMMGGMGSGMMGMQGWGGGGQSGWGR